MQHDLSRVLGRIHVASHTLLLLAVTACNIDYKVVEAEEADGVAPSGSGGAQSGDAGTGSPSNPDPDPDEPSDQDAPSDEICRLGGECLEVALTNVDKIDMLFMVDNSGSMKEEQSALRAQFPKLISVLTTGDRTPDNGQADNDFPPAKNMHLGVVSSDLGLVGVSGIDKCGAAVDKPLGDDGVMNNVASPAVTGCSPTGYPRFLTYTAGTNDPTTIANDLACIASLGTDGCGFEQSLETTLKALWPADDTRVTFLGDSQGFGTTGQGDNGGMNAGFLRSNPVEGLSLLSIVLLTDEEDCSSKDTHHFLPPAWLDPADPGDQQLLLQGLNTRCNFNPQNLYTRDRYINAFKALRPDNEELVSFTAIVGVPPETVADVPSDYGESEAARAAFYQGIRDHELMTPQVDTLGTPSPDDDTMRPSCDTTMGRAYPPNRIVEVAEGLGANGLVQSICQEDFGPVIDALVDRIAARMGAQCLPHAFERDAEGRVRCELVWELPIPGRAPVGTPTACEQSPFLLPIGDGAFNAEGGELCHVAQLAVIDLPEPQAIPSETDGVQFSDGWYYDDFSEDAQGECASRPARRISFTPGAQPPTGVNVYLDCER